MRSWFGGILRILTDLTRPVLRMTGARMAVPSLPAREIIETVFRHGKSSTSFLTLYSGFRYFRRDIGGEAGLIAYVDTPTAWIGAADPAAPLEAQGELLLEFLAAARSAGKAGVVLPISRELADFARQEGVYTVQVGMEPWFSVESVSFLRSLNVARRLKIRGVVVERFDPFHLSSAENQELDAITEKWLGSRASVPLAFLNCVEPWLYIQHKRYFRVLHHSQPVAFLAAVPIPARKSWYLVDLIRLPDAPLGATELLIAEAVEQLKAEGAAEVTLGMSPLAKVDVHERAYHPRTYRILDFVYAKVDFFYGFRSLFEYKEKLRPTRWEPLYLVASPGMNIAASYGLFRALFPAGMSATTVAFVAKRLKRLSISDLYGRILSRRIIVRTAPYSIVECLIRCRLVLALAITNLLFFFAAADQTGDHLRISMENRYGYSVQRFLENGASWGNFKAIILSSFLHWNWWHISTNLVVMIVVCGFLELIAGSMLVGISYLLGILFSNPLTSLVLFPFVALENIFRPGSLQAFERSIDVGCSLGVFACVGAFAHFTRHPRAVVGTLTVGIIVFAILDTNLLDLNHIAAMGIGLLFGRYYVPKD